MIKKVLILCIYFFSCSSLTFAKVPVIDLGQIVITASRLTQYDYEVASNVTVIGQEKIGESNAPTVAAILQEELGVNVYDNSTYKTATVDIRGFGDTAARNVLVLINNRKINSIDISGPDLIQIPLESVEKIEIIRGGASVLYGDNAVGGVINIITKQGKGGLSGQVGIEYASYDTLGQDLEISGEYKDLSYYVYARYYDNGGFRANSEILSKDFNARFGYQFTDKLIIDLVTSWHEDDYRMPGGLNDTELMDLGRRGSADENDFASTKDRSVQLSFDLTPWPENIDWGHFVFDVSFRNRDTYSVFASFGEFATKSAIDTLGMNAKYIFNEKIFGQDMNLVAGFDFYDIEDDIWGSGSNSDDIKITKQEYGAYIFSEFEIIDDIFINGGTRYQKAYYKFDQKNGTPSYKEKHPGEQVSIVGAKYEYEKGSNVFINVQQTFRFLATDEWYSTWSGLNTDLKQQTGVQYEIGLKHNFKDKGELTVTPYWIDIKDEIFYDPASGGFGSNSNYDKTRRMGVEVGMTSDLLNIFTIETLDKLSIFTNYTYQDSEFNGGANDGKMIPMVPTHQASVGVNLGFWDHFFLSFIGRYVGSRFAINDTLNETTPIKPYCTLDGKLSFERKELEMYIAINNIFDEQYYTYVSKATGSTTKNYFPAPELNFNFGMSLKF